MGPAVTDPLIAAADFLLRQLDWLRHATDTQGAPLAVGIFAELGDCAARMRSLVEPGEGAKYLGPCGAQLATVAAYGPHPEQYVECDGDVYGRPGAEHGRCRTCGATVAQTDREQWLDEVRREYLYHASEIAEAYPIQANTIRKWLSRGLIVAHGEHDGRPLLKLGEVLDMAAGDAARREEARARRAAARDTAEMGATA